MPITDQIQQSSIPRETESLQPYVETGVPASDSEPGSPSMENTFTSRQHEHVAKYRFSSNGSAGTFIVGRLARK